MQWEGKTALSRTCLVTLRCQEKDLGFSSYGLWCTLGEKKKKKKKEKKSYTVNKKNIILRLLQERQALTGRLHFYTVQR